MAKGTGLPPNTILAAPDFVQHVSLASSVGQAFDVPAGMGIVNFSFRGDFSVRYGSTAAANVTTSSTAATGSEINPTIRDLRSTASTTVISVIADQAILGTLSWYKPA